MKVISENELDKEVFFPVGMFPLFWGEKTQIPELFGINFKYNPCKKFRAVVDIDRREMFAAVTDSYLLVTNKQAREWAKELAKIIFHASNGINLVCTGYNISNKKAVCELDLMRDIELSQPLINGGWGAFIRVGNSYNKTKTLSYTIGYVNMEFGWQVLDPKLSVTTSEAHLNTNGNIFNRILSRIRTMFVDINDVENRFYLKIKRLQEISVAPEDMFPLVCKFQGIKKEDLKEKPSRVMHFILVRDFINEHIEKAVKKYGANGYALLNVMAAYTTNFNGDPLFRSRMSHNQMAVGKWVDDFISENEGNFSMYDYLGKEAYNAASWLRALKV